MALLSPRCPLPVLVSLALIGRFFNGGPAAAAETGSVRVAVRENGELVPCRIHVFDSEGKTPKITGGPVWKDHVVCEAGARLELPPGEYRYEIERGPEYNSIAGNLKVDADAEAVLTANFMRLVDLSSEGWWSGELHVHRPLKDIPLLMRAEDLHVAPVITWWNHRNLWADGELPREHRVPFDGNRFYSVMAGEDEREGGALLYFGLAEPLAITEAEREYPSPMKFLREARTHTGVHVDVEKPFWWDVPTWLASGEVDSLEIANNHMCRSTPHATEAWGRPRDVERLPAPHGNGYWSQEIYYHAVNCGLRIPPSAGSASGVLPNPLGYNRVYVHIDGPPSYEKWFDGLRAGRTFVTNGPLLRVRAGGRLPGHIFSEREKVEVDLTGVLEGRDRVEEIEIVRDGRVVRKVPAVQLARDRSLGKLTFTSSGWFLVRAIAANPVTFRFASTAPWYVEVGESKHRVSRASARFFLDWTDERMKRIELSDAVKRDEVLQPHRRARKFWARLVETANAE